MPTLPIFSLAHTRAKEVIDFMGLHSGTPFFAPPALLHLFLPGQQRRYRQTTMCRVSPRRMKKPKHAKFVLSQSSDAATQSCD